MTTLQTATPLPQGTAGIVGTGRPAISLEVKPLPLGGARPTVTGPGMERVASLLAAAGITLNGPDRSDPKVYDGRLFRRVATKGLSGLGDAYVDGWWDCERLDEFFTKALRAGLPDVMPRTPNVLWTYFKERFLNLQNVRRAKHNIVEHYNQGNDLFQATLDPYLLYTCAYWKDASNLAEAQIAKMDLVCRKLGVKPGMHVMDLGCGWGGTARFIAERYGARVTGVTISEEQLAYAREFCKGLPVEFVLRDYRLVHGRFDRILSLGMCEHIGPKNYRAYIETIHRCLKDDGLALLQFFATRDSFPNLTRSEVNWVSTHIFPGMVIPSLGQIGDAIDGRFVLEDLHNFGAHYDPTLMAWCANFEKNWPSISAKYGERFFRMWRYYLLIAAGAFRSRRYQLWHLVLSKSGVPGGYETVR